jgi:hypothetical protein
MAFEQVPEKNHVLIADGLAHFLDALLPVLQQSLRHGHANSMDVAQGGVSGCILEAADKIAGAHPNPRCYGSNTDGSLEMSVDPVLSALDVFIVMVLAQHDIGERDLPCAGHFDQQGLGAFQGDFAPSKPLDQIKAQIRG